MKQSDNTAKRAARALDRARTGLEALFLFLAGVYLLFAYSDMTTFFVPWSLDFGAALLRAMAVTALARLILIGPRRIEPWVGLAIAAVCYLCHRAMGDRNLYFLAALTLGFAGIEYRRILRVCLLSVGAGLAVTVLAAWAGAVDNLVYFRDGLRSSWGTVYPTDLSSLVLFLLAFLWVAWRKAPNWAMLLVSLGSLALSLFITMSRNALVCSALLSAMIAWRWLEEAVLERRGVKGPGKVVDWLTTLAFPLGAAAVFGMFWLYARDTGIGLRLDVMLSERLKQGLDGWNAYGFTPFGTFFEQIGNGFSVFPQKGRNFIDSSYLLMLLRNGWVTTLMYAAIWVAVTRRALRCGDRRLALVMAMIAFHSVMEHHFTELHFNPILAMPLAAFPAAEDGRDGSERAHNLASALTLATLVAAGGLLGPTALTRLRTVFGAKGWTGGGPSALPVALVLLAILAVLAVLARALYRLLDALMTRKRPKARTLAALAACVAVAAGAWLWGNGIVGNAARAQAARLDGEAPVIEAVLSGATGDVYADDLPDVYRARFSGLRPSLLCGEDLARHRGATVLTSARPERFIFTQAGFRFAQISDESAVYTDDPAVVAALEAAGFATTNYWSVPVDVNLETEAELNALELGEKGLVLDGPVHSLYCGPYDDLFEGWNVAWFDFELPEGASAEDGEVCLIRITAYWGDDVLAEVPVQRSQFDENGRAVIDVPFVSGYSRAIEFHVICRQERAVYLRSIRYQRVTGAN